MMKSTVPGLAKAAMTILIAFFAGCFSPGGDQPLNPPNVILILADALRADHLGYDGYGRDTSPFLDSLAGESIVFSNARTQAACTFPSLRCR